MNLLYTKEDIIRKALQPILLTYFEYDGQFYPSITGRFAKIVTASSKICKIEQQALCIYLNGKEYLKNTNKDPEYCIIADEIAKITLTTTYLPGHNVTDLQFLTVSIVPRQEGRVTIFNCIDFSVIKILRIFAQEAGITLEDVANLAQYTEWNHQQIDEELCAMPLDRVFRVVRG